MSPKYIFGKSTAAQHLEDLVKEDPALQRKTSRFIASYFHFLKTVVTMNDPVVVKKVLQMPYPVEFEAPEKVRTLCANLMAARRRDILAGLPK